MPVDAQSGTAVATALAEVLGARWGGTVDVADDPVRAGDGFDTSIFLTRFAGAVLPDAWAKPLVLRIHPAAARLPIAEREATVQTFLADAGYPVPRVLEVFPPGSLLDLPLQVMERAPGTTALAQISSRPLSAPRVMARLGTLHAWLHAVPTTGWPATDVATLARRRLSLVESVVRDERLPAPALRWLSGALERLAPHLDALDVERPTVCHGDFHPLNVMLDGNTANVIDWTDACLGDPMGDVARLVVLFDVAAVGAPRAVERLVSRAGRPFITRSYLRAYEAAAGRAVDRRRLRQWAPVHHLHDWTRTSLTLQDQEAGGGARRVRSELLDWLQRRFDALVATPPR
jgi:aminoglycoside phosphotransferase (APT) family kinase protein